MKLVIAFIAMLVATIGSALEESSAESIIVEQDEAPSSTTLRGGGGRELHYVWGSWAVCRNVLNEGMMYHALDEMFDSAYCGDAMDYQQGLGPWCAGSVTGAVAIRKGDDIKCCRAYNPLCHARLQDYCTGRRGNIVVWSFDDKPYYCNDD